MWNESVYFKRVFVRQKEAGMTVLKRCLGEAGHERAFHLQPWFYLHETCRRVTFVRQKADRQLPGVGVDCSMGLGLPLRAMNIDRRW